MKALLVQPPFAQLNAPYPAAHYLEAFLLGRGLEARARDHSIELYRALFSRPGLAPVFEAARAALDASPDEAARSQLERYISYERTHLEWVEPIADFLAGGDPAFAHRLSTAVELPLGMRAEALLESRGGRIGAEEAPLLATRMLEDLGDLVSFAYDPHFATVRYGERIASSRSDFSDIEDALNSSRLMAELYAPLLAREWEAARGFDLLLVTIPFPGSLLGALACARSARRAFGSAMTIVFGGGYVSTELRGLRDGGIFDYCDYLAIDAGYGALASLLEILGGEPRARLYRSMYRDLTGRIVCAGFPPGDSAREIAPRAEEAAADRRPPRIAVDCDAEPRLRAEESAAVRGVFPDYRSADFSRYVRVLDSANPMHRLWSDSPWLKYHLARGCYWRRCAFCDTELEYVADFSPSSTEALLEAVDAASARTGLYGIHFVDEAMPMAGLLGFARANRARVLEGKRPFHFWGNVRFDSSWTEDRCALLAASGLVAVSGGIEIATERGLEMTDKGFDLAGLARALVAMKRSGLLVHAYLIYGFPGQSEADIVDSAEICRQLFAAGLIDSAFWHRFVLTRHSRMLGERLSGGRSGLEPIDRPWLFANNDLSFRGESAYDRYEEPLSSALAAWMEGEELERPADEWFEGGRKRRAQVSRIAPDLVESLVAAAEERAEETLAAWPLDPLARAHWTAGAPLFLPGARRGAALMRWACRGGLIELGLPEERARALVDGIGRLAAAPDGMTLGDLLGGTDPDRRALATLRRSGLVLA